MLRIRTLGGLAVEGETGLVTGAAAQPRRLAILALLARAGSRGVTRDKLINYLWPGQDEERSRKNLAQSLYALRRDLGSEDAILGVNDLRLNPELVTADNLEFEAAASDGRPVAAAEIYGGPFLDGFNLPGAVEFERWMETERGLLAHRHIELMHGLARNSAAKGEHLAAVGWWRRLAAADPLNASIATGLMTSLAASGDKKAAIQHARVHAALLEHEFGSPPDPEVAALAAELLTQGEKGEGNREKPAVSESSRSVSSALPQVTSQSQPVPANALTTGEVALVRKTLTKQDQQSKRLVWFSLLLSLFSLAVLAPLLFRKPKLPTAGRTTRVVFEPELELDPALSPDGKMIAYAAGPIANMKIFVRQLQGGRVIPVSGDLPGPLRVPQWSPDGTTLVFQGRAAIYMVPALGGPPRQLVVASDSVSGRVEHPSWSPDGSRLVFVRGTEVVVRTVTDGGEKVIGHYTDAHSPRWSPNGKFIALVEGNAAFVLGAPPPATGVANIGNIAPSQIWVVPANGGTQVAATTADYLAVSPAWSADGKFIYYVSNRDGNRDVYAVTAPSEGSPQAAPHRLTTGLGAHSIALSQDGRQLAYSVFKNSSNIWSIRIPQGGAISIREATPLTVGDQTVEGISVSPDGQWLAFDSDRGGNQDIWRMRTSGGEPEQVTSTPWDDFLPVWSPDGKELAYYGFNEGRRRLYSVPAVGGVAPKPLTDGKLDERFPHWSPDGKKILFHRLIGERYVMHFIVRRDDLSWEPARQMMDGEAGRWSPDGKRLLYFPEQGKNGLWTANADGTGTARLLIGDGSPARPFPGLAEWSGDGRFIYYKAFDGAGVPSFWVIPSGGGTPRLLVRFDDAERRSNRPEFGVDGKRFYFTMGKLESDIALLQLESH